MSSSKRLSIATLAPMIISGAVTPARVDPARLAIGIVHFGIGAFHRAHQAVFTEDAAAASGEMGWGILGVTGRTDTVVHQLRPQDCLYGVLERGTSETSMRLVASVRGVAWPGRDSEHVVETMARSTTHLATLTITEKGYPRAAQGGIDLSLSAVQHDLSVIESELLGESNLAMSETAIGLLVRGLARRHRRGGAPFTVVSCDNLVGNGRVTHALVTSLVAAVGGTGDPGTGAARDGMLAWLEASVSFPSTMVDRIAPATTQADRDEAFALLGLRDEALVVAEPFSQWVIEDRFAGARPPWEMAGAIMTDDVMPYERAKLRILNATHSLLAYLGALRGYATIAEAVGDPALQEVARRVVGDDVMPTLAAPRGFDLHRYLDTVIARFGNPSLAHTTLQVAMDGSRKLPNRLLGTAVDRLAAGHTPRGIAFAVAAWIAFVAWTLDENGPVLDDPLSALLHSAAGSADALTADPTGLVARMLDLEEVFPAPLRDSSAFREAVTAQLDSVRRLTRDPCSAV